MMNANLKGAILMTASMGSFTMNDVVVKTLAQDIPLFQVVFLRSVLTALLLTGAAAFFGQLRLQPGPGDRARLAWRTFFEIATMVAFLFALINMPIANATAILAALPLSVTVAAALFLGEPLGWRRMTAILVGFLGVMLIVQPGTSGFTVWSLSALVAVLFITGRDIVTRNMGAGLPSLAVALVTAVAVGVFSFFLSLMEPWVALSVRDGVLLMCSAVCIIGGYLFSIMVMRVGEVAVVAPFRYTGLVFALVFGLVFFSEWPNALALLGAFVVMATGIYTILRERAIAARDGQATSA